MKCALCNNHIIKRKGSISFYTRSLGKVSVPGLEFMECTACNDQLLTPEQSDKAIEYIANKEQELIRTRPIGEFITANEAAAILGVTKQAFSKNPKIKKGLIYAFTIDNRRFFNKRSVELFKEQGNGKFLLKPPKDRIRIFQFDNLIGAYSSDIDEKENLIPLAHINISTEWPVVKTHSAFKIVRAYTKATSGSSPRIMEREQIKSEPIPTGEIA